VTVARVDGVDALDDHRPTMQALEAAGFAVTPRGLRVKG
jgi:hypothetical protein